MVILEDFAFGYYIGLYLTRVWLPYIPNQNGMIWDGNGREYWL